MTTPPRGRRQDRPPTVLTVTRQSWLSPTMVRIEALGDLEHLGAQDWTDTYTKLSFDGTRRTYTLRRVGSDSVTIDFVVHGTEGIAGPWAASAKPGDVLTLGGAGGGYRPDLEADHHLFLGDESALPAIAAALDALPRDARGTAWLETCDPGHDAWADVPAGVELVWIDRPDPGTTPHLLAEALEAAHWPVGRVSVFAHGEREAMKAVRAVLKQREVGSLSLSGYWAHGRVEDVFQAEKREPVGRIDP